MNPKKIRAFSLYESQDAGRRRGGRSKFREFLAGVGKTFRPVLNQLASGLITKGKAALAKRVGSQAMSLGADILGSVAQGKSVQDIAQSDAAKKLMAKGVSAGLTHIKGAGAMGVLPDDIEKKLNPENKRAFSAFVKKKKRKAATKERKKKVGNKRAGRKTKAVKRKKKAGPAKSKKAGKVKPKKLGKKSRSKAGGQRQTGGRSKKRKATKGKKRSAVKSSVKSIFD